MRDQSTDRRYRKTVVGIGNCSGRDGDKFAHFSLTAGKAKKVKAPVIEECYANFECKLVDASQIKKYSLYIFKVVHAEAALAPKRPTTIHYRGEGEFMLSGNSINLWRQFKPGAL